MSTAARRESRPDDRVRVFCGCLVLLFWVSVVVWLREILLMEPDLQWHIKTGEWIWRNAAVPTVDMFSHSFSGQPWIAKEWLSQVLYFLAYAQGGWNGVMMLSLLAILTGSGVMFWALSRDLTPIYAALGSILALLFASPSFTTRPHLLTLPLFIIWTYKLFASSRRHEAPPFGLLALLVLWANLHAAFTIGFVLALFAFLDVAERTRLRYGDVLLRWVLFLCLCPLVALIHPYLWKAILATWTVVGPNEAVPLINEWQPFNAQTHLIHHMALLCLILLVVAGGVRLGLAKALLLVLLLHLFLTHIRYAYFLFPVLAILLAPEIARRFPQASLEHWRSQPRDPVESALMAWHRPITAGLAGALILIGALQGFVLRTAPGEGASITGAIGYARSAELSGNVMNHYNFGGALIFNGIPSFLDGRTDQLFLGGFVKEFAHGPRSEEKLSAALQQYDIQWTLFPPDDPRAVMLDGMPGWRLVYSDEHAAIHVRGKDPEG